MSLAKGGARIIHIRLYLNLTLKDTGQSLKTAGKNTSFCMFDGFLAYGI